MVKQLTSRLWTCLKRVQVPSVNPVPPPGQCCATCQYFLDYRETEGDDWANGYCGHPWHQDPTKSPHWEYWGHWTNHADWCAWWSQS
jgi:hypothetical protein